MFTGSLPYLSLFGISFLAATIFPAQSELVLAGMLAMGRFDPWILIVTATTGNVLGSVLNWVMGRYLHGYKDRRWFPISPTHLDRAEHAFKRWGLWTLLLSWVPVIGDPLTLAAGLLRVPLKLFVPIVLVAKAGRYLLISGLVSLL